MLKHTMAGPELVYNTLEQLSGPPQFMSAAAPLREYTVTQLELTPKEEQKTSR